MHYVCTGNCSGVAENEGTCQAEGCTNHGKPLAPCECTDGQHNEVSFETKPAE